MNSQISSLQTVAQKKEKIVLGLMSGTSMDGLDLALCRIRGSGRDTDVELLEFTTQSYSGIVKEKLQKVVSVDECSLQDLCLLHTYLGVFTADVITESLEEWGWEPAQIDCIASHGQTVYHAPRSKHQEANFPNTTLQIGDGDHIAQRTGILTLSDFRQKHTASGGEGAPMASLIDRLLFSSTEANRLLLNIGGIANFTYLPRSEPGHSVTADTGPGNTLLDATARKKLGKAYDEEGATARKGSVNRSLLEQLKADAYFDLDIPKTTGPELFNWEYVATAQEATGTSDISVEDLLATLTIFSVDTIVDEVQKVHDGGPLEVLVSGGGLHNHFLMDQLKKELTDASFLSFEENYLNPDAKEAVCFAILANEMLSGEGFNIDSTGKKINFGKLSLPD